MSNVYSPILDEELERPQKFDLTEDSEFLRSFGYEFSNSFLQSLDYYPLNFTASAPTNIYREVDKDTISFYDSIRISANYSWNLSKRRLEAWGIKETRDLVAFIAIKILEEANITPKVGDQLKIGTEFYKISEIQVDKREPASNLPLSVRLVCVRTQIKERPN